MFTGEAEESPGFLGSPKSEERSRHAEATCALPGPGRGGGHGRLASALNQWPQRRKLIAKLSERQALLKLLKCRRNGDRP